MSAPAVQRHLWAPIRITKRGPDWPIWMCLRMTRRDAKAAFLEGYVPEVHKEVLKGVRFARVTVTEETSDER